MSVNELERVKQDIATIKQAAGLELPFGWDSVWLNLLGAPVIATWYLICWFIFDRPSRLVMAIPVVLLLSAYGYVTFKHRRVTGSSSAKRREYGINFYASIVLVTVLAIFLTWARRAGIDTAYLGSGLVTMCGLMATFIAFQNKKRIAYLGGSIPCAIFGISIAIWPSPNAVIINGCITLFIAGPATAVIQMYLLKRYGTHK